jgi:predicted alpha-1,2-mannosidase
MSRRLAPALAALLLLGATPAPPAPVDQVNVFTGTSNSRWQLYPGAAVPFGLVKLSPDNQGNVWNGGYEYSVGSISGFSPLHAFGLSGPALMPVTGPLQVDPSSSRFHPGAADGPFGGMWTAGYRARFDKASERGSPGYYRVHLLDGNVTAELGATAHVGYMRLRYPAGDQSHLFLDFDPPAEERNDILGVDFARVAPARFEGHLRQRNQYAGTHDIYFVIELSQAPTAVRGWTNGDYTGSDTSYGTDWRRGVAIAPIAPDFHGGARTGAILDFKTRADTPLLVRTALSFVDMDGARRNLAAETAGPGWDFDAVVAQARAAWAERLSSVELSNESPDRAALFYTALYRTFAGKSLMNDVDGRYRDARGEVAMLAPPADAVYSSDALWGTQWTLAPMWSLVAPNATLSMANSLLELQRRGGWIPQAPVNLRSSPVMVAQHQTALIVQAVDLGLDARRAFAAVRHDLTTQGTPLPDGQYAGNRQLSTYLAHGYVPDAEGPSSNTLEYAYDDYCAGELAKRAGAKADAAMFARRAQNWRNQFDPQTGYMRPRDAAGRFVSPFDPLRFGTIGGWNGSGFVEGTAWTYSFFVPHDVAGLVALVGRRRFLDRLTDGFATGKVDLTNQPGLQSPFLFNHAGAPWLTQYWTRRIVADDYDLSPWRGWQGEEDEGQLTAYFALLSLGLFQMDGGCAVNPRYDLTTPAFRRIAIRLGNGRALVIESEGGPQDVYIQSVRLDGRTVTQPWIDRARLLRGGVLHYILGPQPNRGWGVSGKADHD